MRQRYQALTREIDKQRAALDDKPREAVKYQAAPDYTGKPAQRAEAMRWADAES